MAKDLKKQLRNRNPTAFSMDTKQDNAQGCWEVGILAKDKPGLFSDIEVYWRSGLSIPSQPASLPGEAEPQWIFSWSTDTLIPCILMKSGAM
jgi:hypothetical protein